MRASDAIISLHTVITTRLLCFIIHRLQADDVDRASACAASGAHQALNQRMTWRVEDIVQAKRREVQLSELGKQQHCTIR